MHEPSDSGPESAYAAGGGADSEHEDFIPGQLQEYLETRLYLFRLEHNLVLYPDPVEE